MAHGFSPFSGPGHLPKACTPRLAGLQVRVRLSVRIDSYSMQNTPWLAYQTLNLIYWDQPPESPGRLTYSCFSLSFLFLQVRKSHPGWPMELKIREALSRRPQCILLGVSSQSRLCSQTEVSARLPCFLSRTLLSRHSLFLSPHPLYSSPGALTSVGVSPLCPHPWLRLLPLLTRATRGISRHPLPTVSPTFRGHSSNALANANTSLSTPPPASCLASPPGSPDTDSGAHLR